MHHQLSTSHAKMHWTDSNTRIPSTRTLDVKLPDRTVPLWLLFGHLPQFGLKLAGILDACERGAALQCLRDSSRASAVRPVLAKAAARW